MSDIRTGHQKFLFWTDKRPIAPDVETRTTCAISEIGMGAFQVLASLGFIGFMLQLQPELSSADYPVFQSLFGPALIMLAIGLMLVIGTHEGFLATRGRIRRPVFQSGIPAKRTRLSNILIWVAACALVGIAVSLLLLILDRVELSDVYLPELVGLHSVCALAGYALSVIARVRWLLELRGEQGHVLPLDTDGEDTNRGSQPALFQRSAK